MLKKRVPILILLFCFAGTLLAEARVDKNVVYGMYSGLALLMDIYYPERPSKEFGVCLQPGNPLVPPIGYRLGERQCQSAFAPIMIEGAI